MDNKERIMKRMYAVLLIAVIISVPCSMIRAWWWPGHRKTVQAAVDTLPEEMPVFFRKGCSALALYSREPDMWTEIRPSSLRDAEKPEHYFDIELLKEKDIPLTREKFEVLCGELGILSSTVGRLPYAIDEWYQRLKISFAEHRKWPGNEHIKAKTLYIAGILSHYTADACQPLHITIHYDGRVNNKGVSPHSGIHAKVDSMLGRIALKSDSNLKNLTSVSDSDMFGLIIDTLKRSNSLVDRVYELEAKLPSAEASIHCTLESEVEKFFRDRLYAAARFTAILWYSAWVESKKVKIPEWYE